MIETRALNVVIAGGGTGGHLFPGIAVAREIVRRVPGANVVFAGTTAGLEVRVVPREGFSLDTIRSAGLKGKSIVARLRGGALLLPGLTDAWHIVSRRRPDIVIGVGGYSSGPVVLIAALRKVRTMVLEQNVSPGLTNRLLARWVDAAAVTYAETLPFFGRKGFVTGNPVRPEFFANGGIGSSGARGQSGTGRVLVLGGSQGAHAINVAMVAAAAELERTNPGLEVVHQTGARDLEAVREGYRAAGVVARTETFLDGVAAEMTASDLVICRAGAPTRAELAAAGRPAVLVPFPSATDDHQRKNARVVAAAGAAELLDQTELSGPRLAQVVGRLLTDRQALGEMSRAMRQLARPDAAARIVDRVLELAGEREWGQRA